MRIGIRQFIKENLKYFIWLLIPMFLGSIYFASIGNHTVLFLICVSPFLLFGLFLGITALIQFSLLIINFFNQWIGSKVVGIIAVITIYIIAIVALIYSIQYR